MDRNDYDVWKRFVAKYGITESSIMLMLTNDNSLLDRYAIEYLDAYMRRKFSKSAFIFYTEKSSLSLDERHVFQSNGIKYVSISKEEMQELYNLYCSYEFNKNIVFTYINYPETNLLQRILNETEINEKEIVCLALYKLREIPK